MTWIESAEKGDVLHYGPANPQLKLTSLSFWQWWLSQTWLPSAAERYVWSGLGLICEIQDLCLVTAGQKPQAVCGFGFP